MKNEDISNESFLKDIAQKYVNEAGAKYKLENDAIEPEPTTRMDAKVQATRRRQSWQFRSRAFVSVAAFVVVLITVSFLVMPEIARQQSEAPHAQWIAPTMPTFDFEEVYSGESERATTDSSLYNIIESSPSEMFNRRAVVGRVIPNIQSEWRASAEIRTATQGAPSPQASTPDLSFAAAEPQVPEMPNILGGMEDTAPISLTPPAGWQLVDTNIDRDITILIFENESGSSVQVTYTHLFDESTFPGFTPMQINETAAFLQIESALSTLIYTHDNKQLILTTQQSHQYLIAFAHSFTASN